VILVNLRLYFTKDISSIPDSYVQSVRVMFEKHVDLWMVLQWGKSAVEENLQ
jgi:hypothetical protein